MGDWEEKLGAILNDPQTMSRIQAIAQSLEGGGEESSPPAQDPSPGPSAPPLDPRLMEVGMRALAAWRDPGDSRAALLEALRPYLREERQEKLDRALRIARLTRAVRTAVEGWEGGEDTV